MKIKKVILFIIAISFSKDYIAVIDFKGIGVAKSDAKALTQRVTTELIKVDDYAVLERSQIKKILKEQKFQNSGACSDISCAVDVGKIIGAKYIVLGTVSRFGNTYILDARLVDVESSESIRSGDYTTGKAIDNLLLQGVVSIVKQLVGDYSEDIDNQEVLDSSKKIWNSDKTISYFRADTEVLSSYKAGYLDSDDDVQNGLTFAYEYAKPNGWGVGFEYQFYRIMNPSFIITDFNGQPEVDFAFISLYGVKNFTFDTGLNLCLKAGLSSLNLNREDISSQFGDKWSIVGVGVRYPVSNSMSFELGFSSYSASPDEIYNRGYLGLTFMF